MRVGIDARCLNAEHLRGMGKALLAALDEVVARHDVEIVLFADEPRRPLIAPASPRVQQAVWETPGHRIRLWEQFSLPRAARRRRCDVLHATGTWAPWWQPVPTVVTVHDTVPWETGEREDLPAFLVDRVQPRAYRKAKLILTPSANSRSDIIARWPALAAKVRVVPWGISAPYTQPVDEQLDETLRMTGVREPYVLYFGGHLERKRLAWAVQVWTASTPPGVQFVACGIPQSVIPQVVDRVPAERRGAFLAMPFLDESHLPNLYARALAVLYPTLYEGFGFPALEAQAVGRPILMTNASSLRELAGPSAIVLPANDLPAWLAACRDVVSARLPTNEAAREWASGFTWASVADALVRAYRDASA